MQIIAKRLDGKEKEFVELEEVGPVYPGDDVIYFHHVPFELSSLTSTVETERDRLRKENRELLAILKDFLRWADTHPRKCTFSKTEDVRELIAKSES